MKLEGSMTQEAMQRILEDVEKVQKELNTVEHKTDELKTECRQTETDAIRIKGEVEYLATTVHRLANFYYELREKLMEMLEAHIPDEGAAAEPAATQPLKPVGKAAKSPKEKK